MTKADLVRLAAEKTGLTTNQSAVFFDLLASTTVEETKKHGEFSISQVGKLVKAQRGDRIGRNPQTGEAFKIKAKTRVKFIVAKAAKDEAPRSIREALQGCHHDASGHRRVVSLPFWGTPADVGLISSCTEENSVTARDSPFQSLPPMYQTRIRLWVNQTASSLIT